MAYAQKRWQAPFAVTRKVSLIPLLGENFLKKVLPQPPVQKLF
jgi:hypothetical protein